MSDIDRNPLERFRMQNKNRVLIGVLLIALCISTLCSCLTGKTEPSNAERLETVKTVEEDGKASMDPETVETEENKEDGYRNFTERQKKILRDLGLPEEYDALDDEQRSGIISIETMLRYLEETYGGTYCYNSYTPYAGFDPECLTAYRDDDSQRRLITVNRYYRNGEFTYSDNYLEVVSADAYREALEEYFDPILGSDSYWILVKLYDITDSDEYIIKRATGTVLIFIKNDFGTEEEVKEIADQYSEWMVSLDCEYPTGADFIVQDEEDYNATNEFNCSDQIHSHSYRYRIDVTVSGTEVSID